MHHNAMGRLFVPMHIIRRVSISMTLRLRDSSSKLGRMVGRKNFVQRSSTSQEPHILQVKLFTLDSLLLVTAYEPRSRASLHMKMPMYLRKLLLGSGSDDHRIWIDKLIQRVKINWRGSRSLYVDSTIHQSVRKISGKRMLLKIEQHSEEEIKIIIIDTNISRLLKAL